MTSPHLIEPLKNCHITKPLLKRRNQTSLFKDSMKARLWQSETIHSFTTFFESNQAAKALILVGSNSKMSIDLWSDVDFVCVVDDARMEEFFPDTHWLTAFGNILGVEQSISSFTSVTRLCFDDFRRIDLVFVPESALRQTENWSYPSLETQVLFSRSLIFAC